MIEQIYYIDIETLPNYSSFSEAPEIEQELWAKKTRFVQQSEEKTAAELYQRAGIYSEFGKIICISVGIIKMKENEPHFYQKSFFGHNEKEILLEFVASLQDFEKKKKEVILCAHNGKEFDYPFIARRMLINRIKLPKTLDIAGKKPWEVPHLDTMEMWKFGDYKHFTSLNLLAYLFDIPSPKDDIDGSQVANVYYIDKNLDRIEQYCRKDVLTVAQVFLKYKFLESIKSENITQK